MPNSSSRFVAHLDQVAMRYDLMERSAVEGLAAGGDANADAWLQANPPAPR